MIPTIADLKARAEVVGSPEHSYWHLSALHLGALDLLNRSALCSREDADAALDSLPRGEHGELAYVTIADLCVRGERMMRLLRREVFGVEGAEYLERETERLAAKRGW